MSESRYNLTPFVTVNDPKAVGWTGWDKIAAQLRTKISQRTVVAVECYPSVDEKEIVAGLEADQVFSTSEAFLSPAEINALVEPGLTDDPVFGRLSELELTAFLDPAKRQALTAKIAAASGKFILVCGPGATLVCEPDVLVYADMARWEGQLRYRRNTAANLGVANHTERWALQYKRAYFVDWRVADRHKRTLFERWDYVLDTTVAGLPKMVTGQALRGALRQVTHQPFSVVPYFDTAPWGGQWMKERFALDPKLPNYGWGFNCVPEENSLLLKFGEVIFETPSINVIFYQPVELLGAGIYREYGAEFPIRFDYLDTIGGGHLSFQVHPLKEYIREHFGMHYTQDESYYMMEAVPECCVYLGLKDGVKSAEMLVALEEAQKGGKPFDADQFANRWPAKKHDHFLIPAGTVHCSGAGGVVLEISATPYIFTFKLWDWGRIGLDGRPRPIHLNHGASNIKWDRTTDWVRRNLINAVKEIARGDGWREEHTGLHESESLETRRHWFTKTVPMDTRGNVQVLTLIEGREMTVESPTNVFEPFVVRYGECFIVPAAVGRYTMRPSGPSAGAECATMLGYARVKP